MNQTYDHQLYTSWVDVKKAFDSVDHEYLLDLLGTMNAPTIVTNFVRRMLSYQQTNIICGKNTPAAIKIEKGILQGDALSPLLFVLAMEPMSRRLNAQCPKVVAGDIQRNHLVFVDDVKLIATSRDRLAELCEVTRRCLHQMGLSINETKSACNVNDERAFGECLDGVGGYKYLGVIEDNFSMIKAENMAFVREKCIIRVRQLCTTRLSARNLTRGVNEFALSVFNYYIGILAFEPKMYVDIDRQVRSTLLQHDVVRRGANIDRLYLPRSEMGRGFWCVEEMSERLLLKLNQYLEKSSRETRTILWSEKALGTHLALVGEFLATKYELGEEEEIDGVVLGTKQHDMRMARINTKQTHKVLFEDEEGNIDVRMSSQWLIRGNVSPQQEGIWTKLQDRNVWFGRGRDVATARRATRQSTTLPRGVVDC